MLTDYSTKAVHDFKTSLILTSGWGLFEDSGVIHLANKSTTSQPSHSPHSSWVVFAEVPDYLTRFWHGE